MNLSEGPDATVVAVVDDADSTVGWLSLKILTLCTRPYLKKKVKERLYRRAINRMRIRLHVWIYSKLKKTATKKNKLYYTRQQNKLSAQLLKWTRSHVLWVPANFGVLF